MAVVADRRFAVTTRFLVRGPLAVDVELLVDVVLVPEESGGGPSGHGACSQQGPVIRLPSAERRPVGKEGDRSRV